MGGGERRQGGFGMIRYSERKISASPGGQGFLLPVLMVIHSPFLKEEKQENKK